MPIVKFDNVSLSYGQIPLLDNIDLQINVRERVFLIGRNGIGKSTLIKLITKELQPDKGQIWLQPTLKIASLDQKLPIKNLTVFDEVAQGLSQVGELLKKYHAIVSCKPNNWIHELEIIQRELEQKQGWQYEQKINAILSQFQLEPDALINKLSGGWKRRVSLAKALVSEPDLLLLDEPTNHLDLATIEWLENYLANFKKTFLCISHDRALTNKLATRVIEIDRGKIYSNVGNLQAFLKQKDQRLATEQIHDALFNKKLIQEENWIRQGIKARRTRNEGRVRALKALREQSKQRQAIMKKPNFNIIHDLPSGQLILEANNLSYSINNKIIINNFSFKLMRGEKIGLIGPNGCGKSTLLNLLLGKILPQQGTIKTGTNLQIAHFDQLREQLDHNLSALDNVAQGRTEITLNGKNQHIIGYLNNFLFTPERARTPVNRLSGGEINRLLLAKLFSLPVNLLILDEPTNDLDIESLELLEEILLDFSGTLLMVSHDRVFMDNVVTSLLVFTENGKVTEYVGSYSDWFAQNLKTNKNSNKIAKITNTNTAIKKNDPKPELTQELKILPNKIDKLEKTMNELQNTMGQPGFYQQDKTIVNNTINQLKQIQKELDASYARWDELENL